MKKYSQICPECYHENIIGEVDEKFKICPVCKSRKIARQKIQLIVDNNYEKEDEERVKKIGEEAEPVWEDICDIHNSICLKYMRGIINLKFELEIKENDSPCIFGRNAFGKEYFQYDNRISNEHFEIIMEQGYWKLVDKESTNGTMINGKVIQPNIMVELNNGDVIKLGKTITSTVLEVNIDVIS